MRLRARANSALFLALGNEGGHGGAADSLLRALQRHVAPAQPLGDAGGDLARLPLPAEAAAGRRDTGAGRSRAGGRL